MACKFERTEQFDIARELIGDFKTYEIGNRLGFIPAINDSSFRWSSSIKEPINNLKEVNEGLSKQLHHIASNIYTAPYMQDNHLKQVVESIKSSEAFVSVFKNMTSRGSYDNKTNFISINSSTDVKELETIYTHEVLHSLTENVFSVNFEELKPHEQEFVIAVNKLYKSSLKNSNSIEDVTKNTKGMPFSYKSKFYDETQAIGHDGESHYGLSDIREFISEALTNKEFAKYLNSIDENGNKIEDKQKSLLKQFFEYIANFINQQVNSGSVLESVLEQVSNLIESQTNRMATLEELKQRRVTSAEIYSKLIDRFGVREGTEMWYHTFLDKYYAEPKHAVVDLFDNNNEFATTMYMLMGVPSNDIQGKLEVQKLYSKYVDNIFPNSNIKDIVYHGTRDGGNFEHFGDKRIGDHDSGWFGKGIYFTMHRQIAEMYSMMPPRQGVSPNRHVAMAVVNVVNPQYVDNDLKDNNLRKGFEERHKDVNSDGTISYIERDGIRDTSSPYTEIRVNDASQVHILGTEADLHMFALFLNGLNEGVITEEAQIQLYEDEVGIFSLEGEQRIYHTPESVSKYGWVKVDSVVDQDVKNHAEHLAEHRNKMFSQLLLDKMFKSSGIAVIEETNESAFEKKGREDIKGWLDNDGYHINIDQVTADTYVHELTEGWLYALKNSNPEAYYAVLDLAAQEVENFPEVMNMIEMTYEESDNEEYLREFISTLSGFHSVGAVMDKLTDHYSSDDNIRIAPNLFQRASNFMSKIFKYFRSLFYGSISNVKRLDLSSATLNDIFEAITNDFIQGNRMYSPQEIKRLNGLLRSDTRLLEHPYYSLNADFSKKIHKSIDFIRELSGTNINDDGVGVGFNIMNNDQKSDYIARSVQKKDNQYVFRYKGKEYFFNLNSTIEERKDIIKRDILPVMNKYKLDVLEDLYNVLQSYDAFGQNPELDVFLEKYKLNRHKFNKMVLASGMAEGFMFIYKYSDLGKLDTTSKTFGEINKKLKSLYHDDYVGLDPYIIVHEVSEDEFNISILDFTMDNLQSKGSKSKYANIFGEVGLSDGEYNNLNGTLQNNNKGLRTFINGLTALYMVNQGVKIHNMSSFDNLNSSGGLYGMKSIREVFRNYKMIAENKKLYTLKELMSEDMIDMFSSINLESKNYDTKYMSQLRNFILSEGDYKNHYYLKKMFSGDRISKGEAKRVISLRMQAIQKDYGNNEMFMYSDMEYRLLSQAYTEITGLRHSSLETVADISTIHRNFTTTHFAESPFMQYIKERYDETSYLIIDDIREAMKRTSEVRRAAFKKVSNTFQTGLLDKGSKIFSSLYKTVDVIDENGKKIRAKIPFAIHYDMNDPDTKRAVQSGEVSKEMVEYGGMIMEEIKDRSIRNIIHNAAMNGNTISYDDALNMYNDIIEARNKDNPITSAFIPVIQKSSSELFSSMVGMKQYKEVFDQYVEKKRADFSNDAFVHLDIIRGSGEVMDRFGNTYLKQLHNIEESFSLSGLIIDEFGQFKIIDRGRYESVSLNAEIMFNSYYLSSARKQYVEAQYIPAYNAVNTLIKIYENDSGKNKLNNVKQWIDKFTEINIERVSQKETGMYKSLYEIETMMTTAFSAATLGYYLPMAYKNIVWNNQQLIKNTIAISLSRRLSSDPNQSTLPGIEDVMSAYNKILFGGPNVIRKAYDLAYKFQLIEATERDMLNSPMNVLSQRYSSNRSNMHIANWVTDNFSRVIAMTSQMMKDGTWDAWELDKSGELKYNVNKDSRYKTEQGKAILNYILNDNKQLGLEKEDATLETMKNGYNISEMKKMKYFADVYMIGAITSDVKPQIATQLLMRSILNMRLFPLVRLNRLGIGASQHETTLGTGIKAIYDEETGEWITEREVREWQATIFTVGEFFKELARFKKGGLKEWYNNTTEEQRANLYRSGTTAMMIMLIFGIYATLNAGSDDPEKKYFKELKSRYKWIWFDLLDMATVSSIYKNPITAFSFISDTWNVMFGSSPTYKMLRYIPGINTMYNWGMLVSEEDKKEYSKKQRRERQYEAIRTEMLEEKRSEREIDNRINKLKKKHEKEDKQSK